MSKDKFEADSTTNHEGSYIPPYSDGLKLSSDPLQGMAFNTDSLLNCCHYTVSMEANNLVMESLVKGTCDILSTMLVPEELLKEED